MRADRLLSIIWLLRGRGPMTTAQLSKELEVSTRTILRDVDALSAAGVPIYTERGPHGGIRLLAEYKTDVNALTAEESQALFASISSWGPDSLGLGKSLTSGLRKLLAATPKSYVEQTMDVASRIIVDPEGWLPVPENEQATDIFYLIQNAVFGKYSVQLKYHEKNSPNTKTKLVNPHGLVSAGASWYVCLTSDKNKETVYFQKLSRIDEVHPLPHIPIPKNEDIDVANEWKHHRTEFQKNFTPLTIYAWVKDIRWSDIREWTGKANPIPSRKTPPSPIGWTYYQLNFFDYLHAMTVLLRLNADIYIDSPINIRDDLLALIRNIEKLYGF